MSFASKRILHAFSLVIFFNLSVQYAQAQDGSAPLTRSTTSEASTIVAEQPKPASTMPAPPFSESRPKPTSTPVIAGPAAVATITPHSTTPPVSVQSPSPAAEPTESRKFPLGALLWVSMAAMGILAYVFSQLRSKKQRDESADDTARCFDLKQLMEKKLEELTDIRGRIEAKAQEQAQSIIKKAVKGSAAEDLILSLERAEQEYERLQMLYEQCITTVRAKKRVIIIHRWDGTPESDWYPWLALKLKTRGYSVLIPAMPHTEHPTIDAWVSHINQVVGKADANTYFVAHSIGCQAVLRYLEQLPEKTRIGGAVFVAGWITLNTLETENERSIAAPWLERPIDFSKVRSHTSKVQAIFSDRDPYVPLSNRDIYKNELGAEILTEHDRGHFSGSDGVTELPSVLEFFES